MNARAVWLGVCVGLLIGTLWLTPVAGQPAAAADTTAENDITDTAAENDITATTATENATPEGVTIASGLTDTSGEQTVVVRLADRPTPAITTSRHDTPAGALQAHAAATQSPFERFAAGTPHVSIDRRLWLTNAMVVTVDTDRVPLARLGMIDHVEEIHENYQVAVTSTTTAYPTTQPKAALPSHPTSTPHQLTASGSWLDPATRRPTWAPESPTLTTADGTATMIDTAATAPTASNRRFTNALTLIDVPTAWQEFEHRGDGVRVAVLDTGVNPDHPDIEINEENWACYAACLTDGPHDVDGHGTHVSGTVVGGDANDAGLQIGVAPNATLMHAKVLNNTGAGTYGGIVEGMQWAVKNDADVISASLGAAGYNDAFINPVRNAQANGVIVVAAVGNGGSGTSGSPANVYDATAVGSVDVTLGYPDPERSTLDLTNDTVSAVSGGERIERSDWEETYNDTPDDWPDSYVVPDVTAPGNRIWSADTNLDTRTVENVDTADLTLLKGTSMATPHVAGVVALMESNSAIERSPAELQTALETTAVDIDAPATRQGVGRVDADDAVAAVATSPNITATISAVSNRVTAGRTLNVTSTVVNSGTEGGTTTLRLRLNETVVATTETSVIAPGEQTTETLSYLTTAADTGTRTVTLSSDDNIDTQTVRIVEPRVELTNSSISPSRVDETNSTHTVTVLVHNISDDDRPDTITIAMPEQVVVGEVTTVTAVDTAGKSVPIAGIKADTSNTINVSISPDSNATIRDVRVTTAFTARRASS